MAKNYLSTVLKRAVYDDNNADKTATVWHTGLGVTVSKYDFVQNLSRIK
jgi:hypothetical protein